MLKIRNLKWMFVILYIVEKVHGGLFGGGLPPNGQVQMIVGGKCKYEITDYFEG